MKISCKLLLAVALATLMLASGCATYSYDPDAPPADREAAIEDEVLARLQADDLTGSQSFGVTAQGDVITLRGSVPSETIRMRAIGIVLGTPGVAEVIDELYTW